MKKHEIFTHFRSAFKYSIKNVDTIFLTMFGKKSSYTIVNSGRACKCWVEKLFQLTRMVTC
jgi:hypothetical protein